MEYMGNQLFWDDKFLQRGDQPLSPEGALIKYHRLFKEGTVLDVACGDGRNSLYLLQEGYKVSGIDFSEAALKRLETFAARINKPVEIIHRDLSKKDALKNVGCFDNVIINHYRLQQDQMRDIGECIKVGGVLFVYGFGHEHKWDERIHQQDLIQKEDFNGLKDNFDLIEYEEHKDERGFFVTYLFKKK